MRDVYTDGLGRGVDLSVSSEVLDGKMLQTCVSERSSLPVNERKIIASGCGRGLFNLDRRVRRPLILNRWCVSESKDPT